MTLSDSSWNILIIQYFKSHPILYSTIIQTVTIQTKFMCSIIILVPLNRSIPYSHSILYHSIIHLLIQYYIIPIFVKSFKFTSFKFTSFKFIAFIRLVSFNISHKYDSLSFTTVHHSLLCHILCVTYYHSIFCRLPNASFQHVTSKISQSFIFIQHTIIVSLPHSTF